MALQDVDVQYVWRFLREHKIDLPARKSWCESNDPEFAAKAADVVGASIRFWYRSPRERPADRPKRITRSKTDADDPTVIEQVALEAA